MNLKSLNLKPLKPRFELQYRRPNLEPGSFYLRLFDTECADDDDMLKN